MVAINQTLVGVVVTMDLNNGEEQEQEQVAVVPIKQDMAAMAPAMEVDTAAGAGVSLKEDMIQPCARSVLPLRCPLGRSLKLACCDSTVVSFRRKGDLNIAREPAATTPNNIQRKHTARVLSSRIYHRMAVDIQCINHHPVSFTRRSYH